MLHVPGQFFGEFIGKEIGKPIVFNICMLGALTALTRVARQESVMKMLEDRIPPAFLDMYRQALELGFELGAAAA